MLKWIIVEDEEDRAKLIINAIQTLRPGEKIVWFLANAYLNETDMVNAYNEEHLTIKHVARDTELALIAQEEGDIIFLLDIILKGINELSLTESGNILLPIMEKVFDKKDMRRIITITSAQVHPGRQKNAFSERFRSKILIGHWDLDSGQMAFKKEAAAQIVHHSVKKWEALYGDPIEGFFEGMAHFSIQDCHINDRLLEAPTEKRQILTPFVYLSNFLAYDFNQFMRDFNLLDNFGDYVYPNAFEECLKSFGNKDTNWVSLFGLILICWAAYRRLSQNNKDDEIDPFFLLIKDQIDGQYRHMTRRENENTNSTYAALHKVIRYSQAMAPQALDHRINTLRKFYDMLSSLLINENNGHSSLQGLSIDIDSMTFSIMLGIDGDELLSRLNQTHWGLLNNEFHNQKNNQTSRKILDFWLSAHFSSPMSSPSDLKNTQMPYTQWSNRSAFFIENRNRDTIKGITLNFSV